MPFQVLNVPETRKLIKQIPVCRDIRWKENWYSPSPHLTVSFQPRYNQASEYLNRNMIEVNAQ